MKLRLSGDGECFILSEILAGLDVSVAQFLKGCIAAGCDYLKNVRGVGIHTAFKFIKSGHLFDDLKKKGSSLSYESSFKMALKVFMHQTIFDPSKLQVGPLQEWTEEPENELQTYCGPIMDKDYAVQLATGNINMKNGEKQNNFPQFQMVS